MPRILEQYTANVGATFGESMPTGTGNADIAAASGLKILGSGMVDLGTAVAEEEKKAAARNHSIMLLQANEIRQRLAASADDARQYAYQNTDELGKNLEPMFSQKFGDALKAERKSITDPELLARVDTAALEVYNQHRGQLLDEARKMSTVGTTRLLNNQVQAASGRILANPATFDTEIAAFQKMIDEIPATDLSAPNKAKTLAIAKSDMAQKLIESLIVGKKYDTAASVLAYKAAPYIDVKDQEKLLDTIGTKKLQDLNIQEKERTKLEKKIKEENKATADANFDKLYKVLTVDMPKNETPDSYLQNRKDYIEYVNSLVGLPKGDPNRIEYEASQRLVKLANGDTKQYQDTAVIPLKESLYKGEKPRDVVERAGQMFDRNEISPSGYQSVMDLARTMDWHNAAIARQRQKKQDGLTQAQFLSTAKGQIFSIGRLTDTQKNQTYGEVQSEWQRIVTTPGWQKTYKDYSGVYHHVMYKVLGNDVPPEVPYNTDGKVDPANNTQLKAHMGTLLQLRKSGTIKTDRDLRDSMDKVDQLIKRNKNEEMLNPTKMKPGSM